MTSISSRATAFLSYEQSRMQTMAHKTISLLFDHAIKQALDTNDKKQLRGLLIQSGYLIPPEENLPMEELIAKTLEENPDTDLRMLAEHMVLERFIREDNLKAVRFGLHFYGHEVLKAPLFKAVEPNEATHFPVEAPPSIN